MKLFISPHPSSAPYGIKRVVEALYKYLPEYGIDLVNNEAEADVVNAHATALVDTKKPLVYSSHGLYWGEFPWPYDFKMANQAMIDAMSRAQAVTAVSRWVAHAISRAMLVRPKVIHHGIDSDEWTPGKKNSGYILWNKARADVVSNPDEMQRLAAMMPAVPFVTTIGNPQANVQVVGTVEHHIMRDMVQQAGLYLATARETFGIGTLEALACGVPVVGWAHGGQLEIIEHGRNGLLAPPGDYEALARCVEEALDRRAELSEYARQSAVEKWAWAPRIQQYAELFREVYAHETAVLHKDTPPPKVSIIVTAHNLGQYLPDALESVRQQTMADFECVIVDDASTDNTEEVAMGYVQTDGRFRYLQTPTNLKLSGARNFGVEASNGSYILPLDADDMLAEDALETLAGALDDDPAVHIAYGHLDVVNDDGGERRRNDWPFDHFSWLGQMAHLNQLPYSAMIRRDVFTRSGGYRVRDYRAEDAAFWCRVTSLGVRAKKVTDKSTLIYRLRPNSKSVQERQSLNDGDGDWTSWYPWRIGAETPQAGIELLNRGKRPHPAMVPAGAQGAAADGCWPVWSHHDPAVSIIIPCGPRHAHLLIDALDSVQGQTFPWWEVVVVNDTGQPLSLNFAPWARVVEYNGHNIAGARNAGIQAARAPLLLFLDADDLLMPTAVQRMLEAMVADEGRHYIYCDWFRVSADGEIKRDNSKEYDRKRSDGSTHPITVLLPKYQAVDVGMFDEHLPGWEDWEFFIKLAVAGYCGARLPEPLLVYRISTGERREQSLEDASQTLPVLRERYADYFTGRIQMAGCCGDAGPVVLEAKRQLGLLERDHSLAVREVNGVSTVRVEFVGKNTGGVTLSSVSGKKLSKTIKAGNNPTDKYHDVTPADAEVMVQSGLFRLVNVPQLDLKQAVVTGTAVPDVRPVTANASPVPSPAAPMERPIGSIDVTALTVEEVRQKVVGLTPEHLEYLLKAEAKVKTRKPRKTVVTFLETLLADAGRVG